MSTTRELRQQVNDTIITALNAEKVPWRSDHGFPRDILSRRRFDGLSGLLLMIASDRLGFTSCFWGTRQEWESLGGKIKEGPGTQVVFPSWFSSLRPCTLYNLCQVDGDFPISRRERRTVDYRYVDRIIANSRARIRFTDERVAEYHYPRTEPDGDGDYILISRMEHFVRGPGGLNSYYHTIFHELVGHWTEPGARVGFWGGPEVSELRAEMAADFMATELGIASAPYETRIQHHKHIEVWAQRMRARPRMIFKVAHSAALAVDFVLDRTFSVEPRHRLACDEAA
jgi:antirestriction protein ArdC